MKGYVLSKDAFSDMAEIRDYLRKHAGAEVALMVVSELRSTMHRISLNPMAGHLRGPYSVAVSDLDGRLLPHHLHRHSEAHRNRENITRQPQCGAILKAG